MAPDPRFPISSWEGCYRCNIAGCVDAETGLPPTFFFYDSRFEAGKTIWENHLTEAHPSLDFSRFPWIQNVVFNPREIMAARLDTGRNSLSRRPVYSETCEYLMLFGVDDMFSLLLGP